MLVNILSNTVSRACKIEDGLSHRIIVQLGLIYIPFLLLLSEIEEAPVIKNVIDEPIVNGVSAMEKYLIDNIVIKNPNYETVD